MLNINNKKNIWYYCENEFGLKIITRGYAIIGDEFFEKNFFPKKILDLWKNSSKIDGIDSFLQILRKLNGLWAVIIQLDNTVYAAVDRNRTIPIYYAKNNNNYTLYTDYENALNSVGKSLNPISSIELLLSGYVTGSDTLVDPIRQLQPGECVQINLNKKDIVRRNYYRFFAEPKDNITYDEEHYLEKFCKEFSKASKHLAISLKDKRPILPLSAGYDSRLIAIWLKEHNVKDVLCISYGLKDNRQVEIAKRVADKLGFKWKFIEYNQRLWDTCINLPDMPDYRQYGFAGYSTPYIQDLPAIYQLSHDGEISEKSVIIPGHVIDGWASDYALHSLDDKTVARPDEYHSAYAKLKNNPLLSAIIYRLNNNWPVRKTMWDEEPYSIFLGKIDEKLKSFETPDDDERLKFVEWGVKSYISQWIVNNARLYEFFNLNYIYPLANNHIIDFCSTIPSEFLIGRRLYHLAIKKYIADLNLNDIQNVPVISGARFAIVSENLKSKMISYLNYIGLYKKIDLFRRIISRKKILGFDMMFAGNNSPEFTSIRKGLRQYNIFKELPDHILRLVEPYLDKPVYSIHSYGLLAMIIIGETQKRLHQKSKR